MTIQKKTAALLALLAGISTACVKAPDVELKGVRVGGIGFRGATLLGELEISNPNRFAIETDSITFNMEASDAAAPSQWTQVTAGTNTQRFRVEGQDSARAEIPIELAYAQLATPVRSIVESGRFNYRLSGTVFVRKPIRKRIPFSQEGSLALFGTAR